MAQVLIIEASGSHREVGRQVGEAGRELIAWGIEAYASRFDGLAGFGFAKYRFPGREFFFLAIVGILMVPFQSVVVPLTFTAPSTGIYRDSVLIASDDPLRPRYPVVLLTHVEPYFALADNDEAGINAAITAVTGSGAIRTVGSSRSRRTTRSWADRAARCSSAASFRPMTPIACTSTTKPCESAPSSPRRAS